MSHFPERLRGVVWCAYIWCFAYDIELVLGFEIVSFDFIFTNKFSLAAMFFFITKKSGKFGSMTHQG